MIFTSSVSDSPASVAGMFGGGGRRGRRLSVTTALGLAAGLGRRRLGAVLARGSSGGLAGRGGRGWLGPRRGRRDQHDDASVGGLMHGGVVRRQGTGVGEAAG